MHTIYQILQSLLASTDEDHDGPKVIKSTGLDVNVRHYNKSLLYEAVTRGDVSIVQTLLSANANPNPISSSDLCCLHKAASDGRNDLIDLLVHAGASVNGESVNTLSTALHWAAESGHESTVQCLLNHGACLHKEDANGESPLKWASRGENAKIVRLLLDAKADASRENFITEHKYYKPNVSILIMLMANGAHTKHMTISQFESVSKECNDCNELLGLFQNFGIYMDVAMIVGSYMMPHFKDAICMFNKEQMVKDE